jgi:hypothetical protein
VLKLISTGATVCAFALIRRQSYGEEDALLYSIGCLGQVERYGTSEKVNFKLRCGMQTRWIHGTHSLADGRSSTYNKHKYSIITYSVKEALSREAVKLDWRLVLTR